MATSVQSFMKQNPSYSGQANTANRTQAGPHYAKGVLGGVEHFLPAIGSVVGAVGGSLVAPGVGTASGGAVGSVAGQKLQDLLTGQHSSGKTYVAQAALGSLGGVGKGLGAVKGGVNAYRAGEGASVVGNTLRLGTKGAAAVAAEGSVAKEAPLVASNANAGSGLINKISKGADKLGKQAMLAQTGPLSKQGADSAIRDLSSIRKLGYNGFQQAAEHAPAVTGPDGVLTVARNKIVNSPQASKINTLGFSQMVKDHIANGVSLTPAEAKNIERVAQNAYDKHGLAGTSEGPGITSAASVKNALQDIGKIKTTNPEAKGVVNNIYHDIRGTLGDATASVPVNDAMKSQIIGQLKTAGIDKPQVIKAIQGASTWGDLGTIEKNFVTASKVQEEGTKGILRSGSIPGTAAGGKPTLTGIANQAGGRVAEKAVSAGGNLISNMTGKAPKEASSLLQFGVNTAKSSAKTQALSRGALAVLNKTSNSGQSPTSTSSLPSIPSSADTSSSSSTSNDAFSADNIKAAIIADLEQNGGKHVAELTGLYNTFGSAKAQSTLSTTDQAKHDSLSSAISALDSSQQLLEGAGGAKGAAVGQLAKIPLLGQYLNNSGTAYEKTKADTASQLTKAITGSSRTTNTVYQQVLHSLPDVTDTPAQASAKLANLRIQINTQAKRYGFTDLVQ